MPYAKEIDAPQTASLRTRLIGWFFASCLAMIAVTGLTFYWATVAGLQWADDELLDKRVKNIRSIVQTQNPDSDLINHEVSEEMEGPRQIFIRVVYPPGTIGHETPNMAEVLPIKLFPSVATTELDKLRNADVTATDGRLFRTVAARVKSSTALGFSEVYIQVGTDISLDQQVLSWYRMLLSFVLFGGLIVCGFAGWLIIRSEMRPLSDITEATSAIGPTNLGYRLELKGLPTELRELGWQFNRMLDRLEITYDGLKHYADNVAHELRTPLNKMLLGSEVILRKARTVEEYQEAIESNIEECEALTNIVRGLLFVARAENAQMKLQRERVWLSKELGNTRDYFGDSASDTGITLSLDCPQDLIVNVDRLVFQRAINNLVANAISHTSPGGSVQIVVKPRHGSVEILVRDTGEGIAPEHLPHVFDRFYRADPVRAADSDRVGLGLAITKSIVELHGGTIEVRSEFGKGTEFSVTVPDVQPAEAIEPAH